MTEKDWDFSSTPLFRDLTEEQIAPLIIHRGSFLDFKKGEKLTGYQRCLGILLQGTLLVENGSGTPLNQLKAGSLFGVSTVFTEHQSHVTDIYAKEACRIFLLTQQELAEIFLENFRVNENYLSFLTDRIRFLNWKIDLFSATTAEQKLLCYLRHQKRQELEGDFVTVEPMTQLANLLGMGRASLYRAIEALEQSGKLSRIDRKVWKVDLEER